MLRAFGLVYLGTLVHALLLLNSSFVKADAKKFLICLAWSLLGLMPGKHETLYVLPEHLLFMVIVFGICYGYYFRERLMQAISEQGLLFWNILLAYALYLNSAWTMQWWFVWLAIPSAATLLLCLVPWRMGYSAKAICYVWYLAMVSIIGFLQFRFGNFAFLLDVSGNPVPPPDIDAFVSGMAFLYLVINVYYIVYLIPMPAKHQPIADRLKNVRAELDLMVVRFSDDQSRVLSTALIIAAVGGVCVVNEHWHLMSGWLLINITLLFFPLIFTFVRSVWGEYETAAETVQRQKAKR